MTEEKSVPDEIKESFLQRVKSPVFGYVFLAFALGNWDSILFLCLSDQPIEKRISTINFESFNYWSILIGFGFLLFYPLLQFFVDKIHGLIAAPASDLKVWYKNLDKEAERKHKNRIDEDQNKKERDLNKILRDFYDKRKKLNDVISEREARAEAQVEEMKGYTIQKEILKRTNSLLEDKLTHLVFHVEMSCSQIVELVSLSRNVIALLERINTSENDNARENYARRLAETLSNPQIAESYKVIDAMSTIAKEFSDEMSEIYRNGIASDNVSSKVTALISSITPNPVTDEVLNRIKNSNERTHLARTKVDKNEEE